MKIVKDISNNVINDYYELGLKYGALGGKLCGAGGGGFLMFYASDKSSLKTKMNKLGIREVEFKFDYEGTKSIAI